MAVLSGDQVYPTRVVRRLEADLLRTLTLALALGLGAPIFASSTAMAQDEVCDGTFTHAEWIKAMDKVDDRFAAFTVDEAKVILGQTRKAVACLDTIARPSSLGRFARQMALVAFYEQDEITAVRWGMLQRYAAPDLPWGDDFGEDHPLREMLDFADEPTLAGPEDAGLAFPKKGAVFMNGALLKVPEARAEVPNLVQITDKSGLITMQYWQDGAAFRDEILGEPGSAPTLPKWFVPESGEGGEGDTGSPAVAAAEPKPAKPAKTPSDGPKIPNLIAGGGLAVVAGTLYAVGGLSRGGLANAETTPELAAARSQVNIMAMGAGVAFAGAVGIGVTAFVDADGGGMGFHFRF